MFNEEFRIYESLNWLRILRQDQKQLFIPLVISQRERDRKDSVTRESILDNKTSMQNTFNYLCQFVDWYGTDYKRYNISNILQIQIKKAFFLGLALGETVRNKQLIKQMNLPLKEQNILNMINNHIER